MLVEILLGCVVVGQLAAMRLATKMDQRNMAWMKFNAVAAKLSIKKNPDYSESEVIVLTFYLDKAIEK